MNTIFKRTANAIVMTLVSAVFIVPSVVLFTLFALKSDTQTMLYMFIPFVFGSLILITAAIEYKRTLVITDTGMTCNFKTYTKEKTLRHRPTVLFQDIKHIQALNLNSNGLLTKDVYVYHVYLKDDRMFKMYLYPYGKRDEKRIVGLLREKAEFGTSD